MLRTSVVRQTYHWFSRPNSLARTWSLSGARLRATDLVCSLALVVTVAAFVVNWLRVTQLFILPYHDGSHHVANVASLVAGTRANGLGYFLAFADHSPSDALTYGFFGLASSIAGVGRFAFGFVWTFCLAAIATALALHFRKANRPAVFVTLALLLFTGLFQAQQGGARDTRVDLFAASLSTIALLLLVNGRWFGGTLMILVAAFAKGAAISLLLPLAVVGIAFGFFRLRRPGWPTPLGLAKVGLLALLAWFFATRIGPQAVSYNLMATGGSTLQDRVSIFAASAWSYIQKDPWFYAGDLSRNYHGWLAAVALLLLILGLVRRWPRRDLRLGIYALVALAYTALLMTVSPVHSVVLTIWFLPAVVLLLTFLGSIISARLPALLTLPAAGALLVPVLLVLNRTPGPLPGTYAEPAAEIFAQATEMANFLDAQFAGRSTKAVLLVNFIWSDEPLVYNYDVYRVLIQEHLQKSTIALDGWELGSFGMNWRPELIAQKTYPEILFVIQQKPSGIDAGGAVRDFLASFQTNHPECLVAIAQPIQTSDHARQDALRLSPTDACREALFADPAAAH
jgi:hypothetical protein